MSNEPPNVSAWQDEISPGNSPASASDPGNKSQPEWPDEPEGDYQGSESPAASLLIESQEKSYTNLATVQPGGMWLCFSCAKLKSENQHQIAYLKNCGYTEVEYCPPNRREVYGDDYKDKLFFRNPGGLTRCMNALSGERCNFDRMAHDRIRRPELENVGGVGTAQFYIVGYCGGCLFNAKDVNECFELEKFIQEQSQHDHEKTDQHGYPKKTYGVYEHHPYTGQETSVCGRAIPWSGTEESITCNSVNFHGQLCRWVYGQKPKVQDVDRSGPSASVTGRDLVPSPTDVEFMKTSSMSNDQIFYESSSISTSSNHGADQGVFSDSS
jgi:hypothetical protein